MSNYDDDSDDFDFDPNETNAMREVRKAQRAAEKRAKELEAELVKFRENERQRNLSHLLDQRGLNQKVAKFIPTDMVDEQAISSWLDDYADVFTGTAGGGAPQVKGQAQDEPNVDLSGYEQLNTAAAAGAAPVGDEADMLARIKGASTPEELNKLLFGSQFGPAAT